MADFVAVNGGSDSPEPPTKRIKVEPGHESVPTLVLPLEAIDHDTTDRDAGQKQYFKLDTSPPHDIKPVHQSVSPFHALEAIERDIDLRRQFLIQQTLQEDWSTVDQQLKVDIHDATTIELSKETLVAICGASGSGKSALINALLGVHAVLPSEGLGQAVTAVPTEIVYCADKTHPYQIEIVRQSHKDIFRDVNAHLRVIQESDPNEDDDDDFEDEALIESEAALRQLFPEYSRSQLMTTTADRLISSSSRIQNLLERDTLKKFEDIESCSEALRQLTKVKKATSTEPLHDLILSKAVRCHVPAQLLKDGMKIADLPGSGDSNRARSKLANKHLREAALVCVVVDKNRVATDDAAARTLRCHLREERFDGNWDRLMLVATKVDSVDPAWIENWHADHGHRASSSIHMTKKRHRRLQDDLHCQKQQLDDQKQEKASAEKALTAAKSAVTKHKKNRTKVQNYLLTRESIDNPGVIKRQTIPKGTVAEHEALIRQAEAALQQAHADLRRLSASLPTLEHSVRSLEADHAKRDAELTELAMVEQRKIIKSRMDELFTEIVQKWRDEDDRALRNADLNPGRRDNLDVIGGQFKSFVVSAAAYQKMHDYVGGATCKVTLKDPAHSGIPELRSRLEAVTLAVKTERYRQTLNDYTVRIESLYSWARRQTVSTNVKEDTSEKFTRQFRDEVSELEGSLHRVQQLVEKCILETEMGAIREQYKQALKTINRVASNCFKHCSPAARLPKVYPATLRAALIRGGAFKNKRIDIDLNLNILVKVDRLTSPAWQASVVLRECGFNQAIRMGEEQISHLLDQFHDRVRRLMEEMNLDTHLLYSLNAQVPRRKRLVHDLCVQAQELKDNVQNQRWGEMAERLAEAMSPIFAAATKVQGGKGLHKRLYTQLCGLVATDGHAVFDQLLKNLVDLLQESLYGVLEKFERRVDKWKESLVSDYSRVLPCTDQDDAAVDIDYCSRLRRQIEASRFLSSDRIRELETRINDAADGTVPVPNEEQQEQGDRTDKEEDETDDDEGETDEE